MNMKMREAMGNLLQSAASGKDFIVEQLPDTVHQLLIYTFVSELAITIIGLFLIYWSCKFALEYKEKSLGGSYIIGFFIGGVSFVMVVSNLEWIKIWLAPKIFILEYASDLLK